MNIQVRKKLAALLIIAGIMFALTACTTVLQVKEKYANDVIELEYGEGINTDATEYFDMSGLDDKTAEDFKKNLTVSFDAEKDEAGCYAPGEYPLDIKYKGEYYHTFKVVISEPLAESTGELVASGELITTVGNKLSTKQMLAGFATADGSKAKLKLVEANVDFDTVGVYTIRAQIKGKRNAYATQKVFVVDAAKRDDGYIDISIDNQMLVFYQNGQVALVSEIVSGTPGTEYETPKGEYSVYNKATDSTLIGATYVEHVDYWIGYIGHDIGIHDRQTRTEWGGDVYLRDGSHGCINMPLEKVAKLYDMVSEGMPVYVHE